MDLELRELYFQILEEELAELTDSRTGMLNAKYSKIIDCPLCKSPVGKQRELFVKRGFTFVRCENCGMIFVNPQVVPESSRERYDDSRANNLWVEIQESAKEQAWKKGYYAEQIQLLKKYIDKPTLNLIDIGCSSGHFLEISKKHQPEWSVKGVELNSKACYYATQKNLDVEQKLLSELDENQKFDVFTLFGVLEHLSDPLTILKDMKDHSKDTSYVLAIVPNAYSLYCMFLQSKSVSFDGRNHLLYFSGKTLHSLFQDNGFEIIHLDTVLTGLTNIKRQIQWLDPYESIDGTKYIPEEIRHFLESGEVEDLILQYNLGLRLRVLAKFEKNNEKNGERCSKNCKTL
ncbi:MAG: class I SAM-dependent methyltransferase [Phycisphaerae bacterium]|jgi:2-polyprenyl-3-methyl-5-hydroxy-6-metoxy-1,4-benzoquinol methylase